MSVAGKVVVILGASGNVGQGAAHAFLSKGAIVVAVGREDKKLTELKTKLNPAAGYWHQVVAEFETEAQGTAAAAAINAALAGKQIDHIISSIGLVYTGAGKIVTSSSFADYQGALNAGLPQTFIAAKSLLPALKNTAGATYTIVSGGFGHFTPDPSFWAGTLKNAAIFGLIHGLAAETRGDAVRVNGLCIHYSVANLGGTANQWGWPGTDTGKIGELFVALAVGNQKGGIHCTKDASDIAGLVESLSKH